MSRKLLSDDQAAYLRLYAKGKSVQECTIMLNEYFKTSFSYEQIRSYKKNHKIYSEMKAWEFVDHSKQKITTTDQDTYIHENYIGIGNKELAELVNEKFGTHFTSTQMDAYKARNKLNSGLTGYFENEHTVNKGKKLSKELYEKAKPTMFKKGRTPINVVPIGTEKLLSDGYTWVKINDLKNVPRKTNWKQKHRMIWEETYGAIPAGNKLLFLDGNRMNIRIENLALVSLSENFIMNKKGLIYGDADCTKAGINIAKLINKTNGLSKISKGKANGL